MAEKIILFLIAREVLSDLPDNNIPCVAAALHLLKQHPLIREILCIVGSEDNPELIRAFEARVCADFPDVRIVPVLWNELTGYHTDGIPAAMEHTSPGDHVFLVLTGEDPETVISLLLLSRVLKFNGVETTKAVCARHFPETGTEIREITHLLRLFDLTGGFQELARLGSVETLQQYFQNTNGDEAIGSMLADMDRLTESITLFRTGEIKPRVDAFSVSLRNAEKTDNPLIRNLIDIFRRRFIQQGEQPNEGVSIPGLIRWYMENNMIQQALTLYADRIPAYILVERKLIRMDDSVPRVNSTDYEDPDTAQFMQGFLKLSSNRSPTSELQEYRERHARDILRVARREKTLESLRVPEEIRKGVSNLVLIVRLAYPTPYGGYNTNWPNELPEGKESLQYLKRSLHNSPSRDPLRMLNKSLSQESLLLLLEVNHNEARMTPETITIQFLEQLLPGSGYSTGCTIEELSRICRDYLYIKMMRNVTNHASRQISPSQSELIRYLKHWDQDEYYTEPKNVTLKSLKSSLTHCLKNLQVSVSD